MKSIMTLHSKPYKNLKQLEIGVPVRNPGNDEHIIKSGKDEAHPIIEYWNDDKYSSNEASRFNIRGFTFELFEECRAKLIQVVFRTKGQGPFLFNIEEWDKVVDYIQGELDRIANY